jgi:hypothetical protein
MSFHALISQVVSLTQDTIKHVRKKMGRADGYKKFIQAK